MIQVIFITRTSLVTLLAHGVSYSSHQFCFDYGELLQVEPVIINNA